MKNKIPAFLLICFWVNTSLSQSGIDTGTIEMASRLIGLKFTHAEKDSMRDRLSSYVNVYDKMHQLNLPNSQRYPFAFHPAPVGFTVPQNQLPVNWNIPSNVLLPANKNDLAFFSIPQLASLIKNKKISSVELTKFFLDRLKNGAIPYNV